MKHQLEDIVIRHGERFRIVDVSCCRYWLRPVDRPGIIFPLFHYVVDHA